MRSQCVAVVTLSMFSGAAIGQGPAGYWLTGSRNEVRPTIARYDAGQISSFETAGGYDSLIAVHGDVRTAASGGSEFSYYGHESDYGGRYGLDGMFSGTRYYSLQYDPEFKVRAFDGTTDGSYNYFVNAGFRGGVWRADREWKNAEMLFSLGGVGDRYGITYDPTRKSLWVSGGPGKNLIEEYDMSGNLLSSFQAAAGTNFSCLAMDYSTGTLWMSPAEFPGMFVNYTRTGSYLGQFDSQYTATMNFTAGEFDLAVLPEPTTLVAAGVALLSIARRRRSRD